MTKSSGDKYTDPELRDQIKEEVQAGDKGGKPGQWSARKAQLMASEYKSRGGSYIGPKDSRAKHLDQWTREDWQTKDGDRTANDNSKLDGESHRYLPKKAWENMSEGEKEQTEKVKVKGSKEGRQFVPNTERAVEARKEAGREVEEDMAEEERRGDEFEEDKEEREGEEQMDIMEPRDDSSGEFEPTSETTSANKETMNGDGEDEDEDLSYSETERKLNSELGNDDEDWGAIDSSAEEGERKKEIQKEIDEEIDRSKKVEEKGQQKLRGKQAKAGAGGGAGAGDKRKAVVDSEDGVDIDHDNNDDSSMKAGKAEKNAKGDGKQPFKPKKQKTTA